MRNLHPGSGFRCKLCNTPSAAGVKPHRLIVETRIQHYANGRDGTEIVREVDACEDCAAKFLAAPLEEAA